MTTPAGRSFKDILWAFGPAAVLVGCAVFVAHRYVAPAPPKKLVISAGSGEGDYLTYAKLYKEILKDEGVELEIRPSTGAVENLRLLQDSKSDVDVGFVHDGLGSSEEAPDLSSLGSLYYEPIWVFYRGKSELKRFFQLAGRRVAVGRGGGGTRSLALRVLKENGIDRQNTELLDIGDQEAKLSLETGKVDAAFFLATPGDPLVTALMENKGLRLMSVDQAEAIARKIPFLHHLVLPHGAFDLRKNLPEHDVDLVSPTAILLIRDSVHPALLYLLLKTVAQVHGDPGVFERKNEFPIDKDYQFPLSDEAKNFYKSGMPFWQRYLPFWLAILVDRFILLIIPLMALIIPLVKLVPRILEWRVKSRIYQRYGELKFLETQITPESVREKRAEYLSKLDLIEERVSQMKVPLDFSDYAYDLRQHIHFVRERLGRCEGK